MKFKDLCAFCDKYKSNPELDDFEIVITTGFDDACPDFIEVDRKDHEILISADWEKAMGIK